MEYRNFVKDNRGSSVNYVLVGAAVGLFALGAVDFLGLSMGESISGTTPGGTPTAVGSSTWAGEGNGPEPVLGGGGTPLGESTMAGAGGESGFTPPVPPSMEGWDEDGNPPNIEFPPSQSGDGSPTGGDWSSTGGDWSSTGGDWSSTGGESGFTPPVPPSMEGWDEDGNPPNIEFPPSQSGDVDSEGESAADGSTAPFDVEEFNTYGPSSALVDAVAEQTGMDPWDIDNILYYWAGGHDFEVMAPDLSLLEGMTQGEAAEFLADAISNGDPVPDHQNTYVDVNPELIASLAVSLDMSPSEVVSQLQWNAPFKKDGFSAGSMSLSQAAEELGISESELITQIFPGAGLGGGASELTTPQGLLDATQEYFDVLSDGEKYITRETLLAALEACETEACSTTAQLLLDNWDSETGITALFDVGQGKGDPDGKISTGDLENIQDLGIDNILSGDAEIKRDCGMNIFCHGGNIIGGAWNMATGTADWIYDRSPIGIATDHLGIRDAWRSLPTPLQIAGTLLMPPVAFMAAGPTPIESNDVGLSIPRAEGLSSFEGEAEVDGLTFTLGELPDPDIHHDNGHLQNPDDPSDRTPIATREPTQEEIDYYNSEKKKAFIGDYVSDLPIPQSGPLYYPIHLFPGTRADQMAGDLQMDDAIAAYRHFLTGNGADRTVNYDEFMREDKAGQILREVGLARTRLAVDQLAESIDIDSLGIGESRTFILTSDAFSVGGNGAVPYPSTENWQKALGAHSAWTVSEVTLQRTESGSIEAFADVTFHAEDMYNFNPGAADIETGVEDNERGVLEESGLAHQYINRGESTQQTRWQLGHGEVDLEGASPEFNSDAWQSAVGETDPYAPVEESDDSSAWRDPIHGDLPGVSGEQEQSSGDYGTDEYHETNGEQDRYGGTVND